MGKTKDEFCQDSYLQIFQRDTTKINKELQVVDSGQALLDGSDRRNTGSSVPWYAV